MSSPKAALKEFSLDSREQTNLQNGFCLRTDDGRLKKFKGVARRASIHGLNVKQIIRNSFQTRSLRIDQEAKISLRKTCSQLQSRSYRFSQMPCIDLSPSDCFTTLRSLYKADSLNVKKVDGMKRTTASFSVKKVGQLFLV